MTPCQSYVRMYVCKDSSMSVVSQGQGQGRQPPGRSVLRRRSFTYTYSYLFITYSLFLFPDIDRYTIYTDNNTFFFVFFSVFVCAILYIYILCQNMNTNVRGHARTATD